MFPGFVCVSKLPQLKKNQKQIFHQHDGGNCTAVSSVLCALLCTDLRIQVPLHVGFFFNFHMVQNSVPYLHSVCKTHFSWTAELIKNSGPPDTAQSSCLSHCLMTHWSLKKKKMIHAFFSSVSFCDASHAPFCSFCFSSCDLSVSFSSSSPLDQMRSGTGCISFSSLQCPHHAMMNRILGVKK